MVDFEFEIEVVNVVVMRIERMQWERILREVIGYRSLYTISKLNENFYFVWWCEGMDMEIIYKLLVGGC